MQLIGHTSNFKQGINEVTLKGESLLVIVIDGQYYLIENKCGHFGVPLVDGDLEGNTISCSQHHISFSLSTGKVVNRPYENCDKIQVFQTQLQDDSLYRV